MPRQYDVRKTHLVNTYTRILNSSSPLLLLSLNNFSVQESIKLRREIAALKPAPTSPSLALSPAPVSETPQTPQLTIVNTGLLGVALRERMPIDITQKRAFAKLVTPGPLAILTLPSLHPPQLGALIRVLERAVPPKKAPPTAAEKKAALEAARLAIIENPTPGRRPKRVSPNLPPELELKGALIEGRLFVRKALDDVAKLPTLDTLRGQLLGLISAPAMQLAGVLNEASGAALARTLEGFRKGLEMESESEKPTEGEAEAPSS